MLVWLFNNSCHHLLFSLAHLLVCQTSAIKLKDFFLLPYSQSSITSLNFYGWDCNVFERWLDQFIQCLDSTTLWNIKWKCMLLVRFCLIYGPLLQLFRNFFYQLLMGCRTPQSMPLVGRVGHRGLQCLLGCSFYHFYLLCLVRARGSFYFSLSENEFMFPVCTLIYLFILSDNDDS